MTRGRRFGDTTAAQVDAWVERQQERDLAEFEAEQDRLDEETGIWESMR